MRGCLSSPSPGRRSRPREAYTPTVANLEIQVRRVRPRLRQSQAASDGESVFTYVKLMDELLSRRKQIFDRVPASGHTLGNLAGAGSHRHAGRPQGTRKRSSQTRLSRTSSLSARLVSGAEIFDEGCCCQDQDNDDQQPDQPHAPHHSRCHAVHHDCSSPLVGFGTRSMRRYVDEGKHQTLSLLLPLGASSLLDGST